MDRTAAAGFSKDAGGGTASPYGTRSRNRTGASRPNYAEDKDLDMDLYDYGDRRDGDPKKAPGKQPGPTASVAQTAAPRSSTVSSRKPLPSLEDAKQGTSHNGTKEQQQQQHQHHHQNHQNHQNHHQNHHHQGHNQQSLTASPVASAGTANGPTKSKKRKAEVASNASGSQTPSTSSAPASALARRLAALAQAGNSNGSQNSSAHSSTSKCSSDANGPSSCATGGSRSGYGETNMLTFENCKATPKNGKMVADDGTVLEVNGRCNAHGGGGGGQMVALSHVCFPGCRSDMGCRSRLPGL